MHILNLVNPEEGNIKYKISNFPDGQQDLTIESPLEGLFSVQIRSRFNSFKDLELIMCAVAAIRRLGMPAIHLYVPYLLGARSDRRFIKGGTSYLEEVIAPIINGMSLTSVTCIDVHSGVAQNCINSLEVIDNTEVARWALSEIYNYFESNEGDDRMVLVTPDSGALFKMHKLINLIDFNGLTITCSKQRNSEGKITKTVVPITEEYSDKDLIIIDDICDGGATFINIAKSAIEQGHRGRIILIVTHGIFSKGFSELLKYFDCIYTTNSYSENKAEENKSVHYLNIF